MSKGAARLAMAETLEAAFASVKMSLANVYDLRKVAVENAATYRQ